MNAINVSVNVTVDFSEQTKQFITALLRPYGGCVPCATGFDAEEPKAEEPKAEEPKAEEPKAEEPKAEEPKPSVSIEDVRKALQEKVNDHREKIKAKLTELGSANVTKLDPKHYNEMYNFLINL